MTRYAVLLRGVNVGGRNRLAMADLRAVATDLGYSDVATYVQSGNLVLTAPTDAATVAGRLREALKAEQSLDVDVVVRSRADVAAILDRDPLGDVADDPAKYAVSCLTDRPSSGKVEALDPEEFAPERFVVVDRELYLWCPDGLGRSKLAAAPWDRRLGVSGTVRNWRTMGKLLELLDAAGG